MGYCRIPYRHHGGMQCPRLPREAHCALTKQPFECDWDAGATIAEHQVRAVATLRGGGRIVHTVRTKSVGRFEAVEMLAHPMIRQDRVAKDALKRIKETDPDVWAEIEKYGAQMDEAQAAMARSFSPHAPRSAG